MPANQPCYRRHPALALLAANLAIFALVVFCAEVFLRVYIPFNPGYYTGVATSSTAIDYPYGRIPINSDGFPDADFDLSRSHRVGYFGDSVTYGVGAGYGYRISELLESAYPEYEHLNLGGIGLSISQHEIDYCVKLARRYSLDHALYLMNLNDIVPDQVASGSEGTAISTVRSSLVDRLDWLRGRSYVYTYLRAQGKALLEAHGVGFHGYPAYELFPRANTEVVEATAKRVQAFQAALAAVGVKLAVVLLPYEMQISAEAEAKYRSLGVQWEDGFLERGTQKILLDSFGAHLPVADAYFAFVDRSDPNASRQRNRLGQYFVYDKGDKLDWNHPNRAGHRAIASFLAREKVLGEPVMPISPAE